MAVFFMIISQFTWVLLLDQKLIFNFMLKAGCVYWMRCISYCGWWSKMLKATSSLAKPFEKRWHILFRSSVYFSAPALYWDHFYLHIYGGTYSAGNGSQKDWRAFGYKTYNVSTVNLLYLFNWALDIPSIMMLF